MKFPRKNHRKTPLPSRDRQGVESPQNRIPGSRKVHGTCTVFDARKLEWFRQAIRTGLLIESENQMPTCLEAMMERGAQRGREEGRQEGIGKGVVIGRIRTLQQIFRQPVTPEANLVLLTNDALQALLQKLEKQLDGPPVP